MTTKNRFLKRKEKETKQSYIRRILTSALDNFNPKFYLTGQDEWDDPSYRGVTFKTETKWRNGEYRNYLVLTPVEYQYGRGGFRAVLIESAGSDDHIDHENLADAFVHIKALNDERKAQRREKERKQAILRDRQLEVLKKFGIKARSEGRPYIRSKALSKVDARFVMRHLGEAELEVTGDPMAVAKLAAYWRKIAKKGQEEKES